MENVPEKYVIFYGILFCIMTTNYDFLVYVAHCAIIFVAKDYVLYFFFRNNELRSA